MVTPENWIFGMSKQDLNPIIWVMNFTIYKCHILVCEGMRVPLLEQVKLEFERYSGVLPILELVTW